MAPVCEDAPEPREICAQPSEGSAAGLPLAPAAALLAAASAVAAEEASSAESRVRHRPGMLSVRTACAEVTKQPFSDMMPGVMYLCHLRCSMPPT